jgi:hypothetical protein
MSDTWPFTKKIDLSLDNLNTKLWMQSRQIDEEDQELGLCMGELQAPNHTLFMINDKMTTGTLVERGILACLSRLQ